MPEEGTDGPVRTGQLHAAALVASSALLLAGGPETGTDLESASYTLRGGHVPAGATARHESASFSGAAAAGQAEAIGFSGTGAGLETNAPGLMPILAGGLPSLDGDGDGLAFYLDDDGDGLADDVETNTGVFASAGDTGTDSLDPDSDGDGVPDGVEVLAGTDPNDPLSLPGSTPLPALGPVAHLLAIPLLLASGWLLRRRHTKRNDS